jgi:hypothetical protein
VLLGLAYLFVFHIISLLIGLHADLYNQYQSLLQKGMRVDQLPTYNPLKVQMLSMVQRFFNVMFKFIIAVGIWMGVVSYYKRREKQDWIKKML